MDYRTIRKGGLRGQAINENKPGDSQDFFSENKVDGVSTPGIIEGWVYMLLSFQGVHALKGFKSCDLDGGYLCVISITSSCSSLFLCIIRRRPWLI